MPTQFSIDRFQEKLRTKWLGRQIILMHEVGSTNDFAKILARNRAPEGTVVVSEHQKNGRGRLGRKWVSPTGGLWFSVILRPKTNPADSNKLVFAASLTVAKTLDHLYGLRVETKWPNDVLVNGRKICGILSESTIRGRKVGYSVIGIGINVNFDAEKSFGKKLGKKATSLQTERGEQVDVDELFRCTLEKMESLYDLFASKGFLPILQAWKEYAHFLGRRVEISDQSEKFEGIAIDVDVNGSLMLRLDNGKLKTISSGDVFLKIEEP